MVNFIRGEDFERIYWNILCDIWTDGCLWCANEYSGILFD